jgi:hypothetical protein
MLDGGVWMLLFPSLSFSFFPLLSHDIYHTRREKAEVRVASTPLRR